MDDGLGPELDRAINDDKGADPNILSDLSFRRNDSRRMNVTAGAGHGGRSFFSARASLMGRE